ncbi:hypothetical protein K443DRAFT_679474 [Laccaria amethystina LaAM-08-1]|uniref:Uncharacterized protein n=1 Tax=Laccaria amethystina LaAM-08-1 TaxID=1095629 RepID=A0A0C9XQS7_9AGAR|nr:hypothetical protein K443DRAFT_679474 [Laccaria amethystina LaAM-08-1]
MNQHEFLPSVALKMTLQKWTSICPAIKLLSNLTDSEIQIEHLPLLTENRKMLDLGNQPPRGLSGGLP